MTAVTGRCLCAATTFTCSGEPRFVAHCHCESCRRQTGSVPATFVGYRSEQVTYAPVPPMEYESSTDIYRGFCSRCGSALHYRPQADQETHMYLGAFDDPAAFIPQRHTFYDEHVAPYEMHDNLPRYDHRFAEPIAWGPLPTRNILFLCTGNSARSILAEAIANRITPGGIRAYSAGSQPKGAIHDDAIQLLQSKRFNVSAFQSKKWDTFTTGFDIHWVITLCDNAANETCPVFPGTYATEHWGLPDPATGNVSFEETYANLTERISKFFQRVK